MIQRTRCAVLLAAAFIATLGTVAAHADPASDLKQFREYFKAKFPTVPFDEFANGLYALHGMDDYRTNGKR